MAAKQDRRPAIYVGFDRPAIRKEIYRACVDARTGTWRHLAEDIGGAPGVPGDYQIMNHIFDNSDQDSGAYPRLAHRFGLGVGAFVQARMEMMRDAIAQAVSEKSTDLEPVRITSVGEGPAREVAEYLEMGEPSHPVTFCLIDQEADALAYAESQCADALDT